MSVLRTFGEQCVVQCTVYSVLCSVQCTVYSVLCSVQCTVCYKVEIIM